MSEMSRHAFDRIVNELPERRAKVYDTIKRIEARNYKPTIRHIAYYMKSEKNEISGRLTELQDLGLIIDTGEVVSRASVYRTTTIDEVPELQSQRQSMKFQNDITNFLKKHRDRLDPSIILGLEFYL